MIAERIYHGETAGQIGITAAEYASRLALLDRYLADRSAFGAADYLAWLATQAEGDRGTAGNTVAISPPWSPDQPSRGLGDTIAKITHATGLDKLSKVYTAVTGKDCGCHGDAGRQGRINRRVPYRSK